MVHAVRIDEGLEDRLSLEAEKRNITFNSFMNSILTKYIEFDNYVERFGFITITKDTFKAIVSALNRETLEIIARDISALALREFNYFKYNEPGVKSFLDFVSLLCKYGGIGQYEFKNEGLDYRISIRHNLGRNVSVLMGMIFNETIKILLETESRVEDRSENEVVIRFTAHPFHM